MNITDCAAGRFLPCIRQIPAVSAFCHELGRVLPCIGQIPDVSAFCHELGSFLPCIRQIPAIMKQTKEKMLKYPGFWA